MEALADKTGRQILAAYCDGSEFVLLASAGTVTEERTTSPIGQRLPVIPPIGIWWMAFADVSQVDTWLHEIASPELRERYHQALAQIRERGYCFGLETVQAGVESVMRSRAGPHAEPTLEERQSIGATARDPLDHVPPGGDYESARRSRPDVVSLWAPTFTSDGEIALGFGLTRFPRDKQPPDAYADEILGLAREVTALLAS